MTDHARQDEPTNAERALWAKAALSVFTHETFGGDHPDSMDPGDLENAISDLICDLLHLASRQPLMNPLSIHDQALSNFEAEIALEKVCDCADRSWYGVYHDTACPVSNTVSEPKPPLKLRGGYDSTVFWMDGRFKVEITRHAPPPMAPAQLILKVYPITNGVAWEEPYHTFAVDEGRVSERERQKKE